METRLNKHQRRFTHPFADGDGLFGQGLGVRHVVLHYGLEQLVFVLPVKRRLDLQRQTQGGSRLFDHQAAVLCLTFVVLPRSEDVITRQKEETPKPFSPQDGAGETERMTQLLPPSPHQ